MSLGGLRLCIFCRALEPKSEPCQQNQLSNSACSDGCGDVLTSLAGSDAEEALLGPLRSQPSNLCRRCAEYDPLGVFRDAEAFDVLLEIEKYDTDERYERNKQLKKQFELPLGRLSRLVLEPSCPFCRLLYSTLVRADARSPLYPDDDVLKLVPFRSHTRENGWEAFPPEMRAQSAIFLGLNLDRSAGIGAFLPRGVKSGQAAIQMAQMRHEVIALETAGLPADKRVMNAKLLDPAIDFPAIRKQLDHCLATHGSPCKKRFPEALLKTTMIDVYERITMPCPAEAEYVALSYMWGGVEVELGALEAGVLPQTLEDAIEATRRLGRRYVWIDALCIDQSKNPTPEQRAKKNEQLQMMDLIYESASVVIVALAGTGSRAGLPGCHPGRPRVKQARETIGGCSMFTVPPNDSISYSKWDTRAWTMQEFYMARHLLVVSEHSACYSCTRSSMEEFYDSSTVRQLPRAHVDSLSFEIYGERSDDHEPTPSSPKDDWTTTVTFLGLLGDYTNRDMSFEGDSLNAMLGILNMLKRSMFQSGFTWGLPLKTHPQFLGWYHDRSVGRNPRRRSSFPSWSWTGWQGEVTLPDNMVSSREETGFVSPEYDMAPIVVGEHDLDSLGGARRLDVKGWVVELHVRTDPLSEAFPPPRAGVEDTRGEDEDSDDNDYPRALGPVMERNLPPHHTLPMGVYSCLVAQRVRFRRRADGPERQRVFLVMLQWEDDASGKSVARPHDQERRPPVATRRTALTVNLDLWQDFMTAGPVRRIITLA